MFKTASKKRYSIGRNNPRSYKRRRGNLSFRVARIESSMETKENVRSGAANQSVQHNNVLLYKDSGGSNPLNPFTINVGAADPSAGQNNGNRVGDQINLKGMCIKAFFENALGRARVYYRLLLLRGSKGETFDRSTIFKNNSGNKMIDIINTEKFKIIAQKTFTISTTNNAPLSVGADGVPSSGSNAGISSKLVKLWIPGKAFGRFGKVQFEDQSGSQVRFWDYRILVLAYDWYGTAQDINNVGKVNELMCKLYFKDA